MFNKSLFSFALLACYNYSAMVFGDQNQADIELAEQIVVTATRSKEQAVTVPAGISVIAREDIEASGALHISELLRGQGAIQIADNFGDGSQVSVGMRGFGETANANTLILVDGRRLNNSDSGNPDLNSIALKDIERIEIVHGSASILYGDQAVGGVINIITQEPDRLIADAQLTSGNYDGRNLQAQLGKRFYNGFALRFSAQARESDNYREHNAVDYTNALIYGAYDYDGGSVFLESQTIRDEIQTPGALFQNELLVDRRQSIDVFANDYSLIETDITRFGLSQNLSEHWSLMAEYTARESDGGFLLSFRSFPGSLATQDRKVETLNPRLQGRYSTTRGTFLLTLGYDQETTDYELISVLGRSANDQETSGIYMQAIMPVSNKVKFTLGARSAQLDNEMEDGFSYPNGIQVDDKQTVAELGLEVRADNGLRHFIRFAENYRFPKIDENTTIFPQPGTVVLETQTGLSTEIGVEWLRENRHAKAIFYRLDLDNEIIYDPLSFQNINVDQTHRQGFIFDGQYQFRDGVSVQAAYTYTDAEIESGIYQGNQVPFIAEHMLNLGLDYRFNDAWRCYLDAYYLDKRYFSGDFANDFEMLDGYTVANFKLDYSLQNWQISFMVKNLFDKAYTDFAAIGYNPATFQNEASFFPSPQRNFWLTLRYHIN